MSAKGNRKQTFSHTSIESNELFDAQVISHCNDSNTTPKRSCRKRKGTAALSSSPDLSIVGDGWCSDSSPNESKKKSPSLSGTRMDVLHCQDEEIAELTLFYTKSLVKRPSVHALEEFIDFSARTGLDEILFALGYTNTLEEFYLNLFKISLRRNAQVQCVFFRFIEAILKHSNCELLCNEYVVGYLLDGLKASVHEGITKLSLPPLSVVRTEVKQEPPQHWSDRQTKKRRLSASEQNSTDADLEAISKKVTQLGSPPSSSTFSICLRIILLLLFFENQRITNSTLRDTEFLVASYFVSQNGIFLLAEHLERSPGDSTDLLSFLEVLTASSKYYRYQGLRHITVQLLCALIRPEDSQLKLTGSEQVAVLKILTNITNVQPDVLTDAHRTRLAAYFCSILLHNNNNEENITFSLCCAINIIKWEVKNSIEPPSFSLELTKKQELYHRAATAMITNYHSHCMANTVQSGYYAIFLALLSCVKLDGDYSSRTFVTSALTQSLKSVPIGEICQNNPMHIVVVIIQEFIIFQSNSKTLTADTLVELKSLLDVLINVNSIKISKSESF